MSKRSHKTVTLQQKYDAIQFIINKTKTSQQVSLDLCISRNTVNEWIRKKDKIFDDYNSKTSKPSAKSVKSSSRPQVEAALLEWFQNLRLKTGMCTGPIMIEKANQFAISFGLPPTCDKNYIYRWRERNSVVWHGKVYFVVTVFM